MAIMTPFLVARLTVYGVIMTVGMIGFQRFIIKQRVSVLKIILMAICAPFIIFICMSILDSFVFSLLDERSFHSYIPRRILLYLSRFYMIGVIAVLITGLIHYVICKERSSEISAIF